MMKNDGNDDDDWGDDDDDDSLLLQGLASVGQHSAEPTKSHGSSSASAAGSGAISKERQEAADKDNSFREFRKLCAEIAEESSYNSKTAIVARFLDKGSTGSEFDMQRQ